MNRIYACLLANLAVALGVLVSVCANSALPAGSHRRSDHDCADTCAEPRGQGVTVFAVSSLTDAFTEVGQKSDGETGGGVMFNFWRSSDLRAQLEQVRPATLRLGGPGSDEPGEGFRSGKSEGRMFVHTKLVVTIPRENPGRIGTRSGSVRSGPKVILANSTVPVEQYARPFRTAASADPGYGSDCSEKVMAKLASNAGVVYKTNVTAELAKDVTTIEIPDDVNQLATYPIAMTTEAGAKDVAQACMDFVLSSEGRETLSSHGFIKVTS